MRKQVHRQPALWYPHDGKRACPVPAWVEQKVRRSRRMREAPSSLRKRRLSVLAVTGLLAGLLAALYAVSSG